MDTSKEYIKMCEKAKAIQKIYWDFNYPDSWIVSDMVMACKEHQKRLCFSHTVKDPCEGTIGNLCLRKSNEIWLPRQDQLQEMIEKETPLTAYGKLCALSDWLLKYKTSKRGFNYEHDLKHINFMFMEQLWLAFVMKEKYGKTWNGKEWR